MALIRIFLFAAFFVLLMLYQMFVAEPSEVFGALVLTALGLMVATVVAGLPFHCLVLFVAPLTGRFCGFCYTVFCHPRRTFKSIPGNWRRLCLATDVFTPVQLLPLGPSLRKLSSEMFRAVASAAAAVGRDTKMPVPEYDFDVDSLRKLEKENEGKSLPASLGCAVVAVYLVDAILIGLAAFVAWLLALFNRFSVKVASLVYLPFAWVLSSPRIDGERTPYAWLSELDTSLTFRFATRSSLVIALVSILASVFAFVGFIELIASAQGGDQGAESVLGWLRGARVAIPVSSFFRVVSVIVFIALMIYARKVLLRRNGVDVRDVNRIDLWRKTGNAVSWGATLLSLGGIIISIHWSTVLSASFWYELWAILDGFWLKL